MRCMTTRTIIFFYRSVDETVFKFFFKIGVTGQANFSLGTRFQFEFVLLCFNRV